METKTEIVSECIFCGATKFHLPSSDYTPKDGDLIKCGNCGKLNDYFSLKEIAQEKGRKWAGDYAKKLIKDALKI